MKQADILTRAMWVKEVNLEDICACVRHARPISRETQDGEVETREARARTVGPAAQDGGSAGAGAAARDRCRAADVRDGVRGARRRQLHARVGDMGRADPCHDRLRGARTARLPNRSGTSAVSSDVGRLAAHGPSGDQARHGDHRQDAAHRLGDGEAVRLQPSVHVRR